MVRIELSLLNAREALARLERIEADCKAALSALDDGLGVSEEYLKVIEDAQAVTDGS